jgi:hypothetical protein
VQVVSERLRRYLDRTAARRGVRLALTAGDTTVLGPDTVRALPRTTAPGANAVTRTDPEVHAGLSRCRSTGAKTTCGSPATVRARARRSSPTAQLAPRGASTAGHHEAGDFLHREPAPVGGLLDRHRVQLLLNERAPPQGGDQGRPVQRLAGTWSRSHRSSSSSMTRAMRSWDSRFSAGVATR